MGSSLGMVADRTAFTSTALLAILRLHNFMQTSLLIIASGSTGNNIFCTPAIQFLRKHLPSAQIGVVALDPLSAQVFAGHPAINQVHVTDSKRQLTKLAKQYQHVIALNKNAMKKFVGVELAIALATVQADDVHHADQLLAFARQWLKEQVGVDAAISEEDRQYHLSASEELSHLAPLDTWQSASTVINIHLGCGTTLLHGWKFFYAKRAEDKKLWPLSRYIALGLALHQHIAGLRIVITGTKNEAFLAKQFTKAVPNTLNLVGKTSISDLRALMDRAHLFIAHDCGVFHVAAASQVPMLGLFGPTNHRLTGPYPQRAHRQLIIQPSMSDIAVEEVLARALAMLNHQQ